MALFSIIGKRRKNFQLFAWIGSKIELENVFELFVCLFVCLWESEVYREPFWPSSGTWWLPRSWLSWTTSMWTSFDSFCCFLVNLVGTCMRAYGKLPDNFLSRIHNFVNSKSQVCVLKLLSITSNQLFFSTLHKICA